MEGKDFLMGIIQESFRGFGGREVRNGYSKWTSRPDLRLEFLHTNRPTVE
jgi:hypothetical protein